jgi:probable HAF family extracellular repeat protein
MTTALASIRHRPAQPGASQKLEDRMKSLVVLVSALAGLGIAACSDQSDPLSPGNDGTELGLQAKLATYKVVQLGSLGGTASSGNGISNPGLVAGSSNVPGDGASHAALWQNGTLIDLGTLGGPNSNAAWPGINSRGTVVGIAETPEPGGENWSCQFFFPTATGNQCLGFVWEDGVMTPIPTWAGGVNGFATEVNNRGQVVGWAENGVEDPTCNPPVVLQFRGYRFDTRTGEMRELTPLPGDSTSTGNAINERGQVVGISGRCANAVGGFSAEHAALWEPDGTVIEIDNLGGEAWHTPMDINEHGDVTGFGNPASVAGDAFAPHAFLWTRHGGIVDLGVLDGDVSSQGLGINDRGQVVGLSRGAGGDRAVLWEEGGTIMTDLNTVTPGYDGTLLYAGHINDAGVITGAARDADTGDVVTFVATPVGGNP